MGYFSYDSLNICNIGVSAYLNRFTSSNLLDKSILKSKVYLTTAKITLANIKMLVIIQLAW